MPEKRTLKRASKDKREGKAPSTQAGEFVREEIEHIRAGKHGARSAKQAIAIGLSKARRAGVELPPPKKGEASEGTRRKARQDAEAGAPRVRKATTRKAASKTVGKTASKTATGRTVAGKATAKKAAAKTGARKTTARKAATKSATKAAAAPAKTRSRATTQALKREGHA